MLLGFPGIAAWQRTEIIKIKMFNWRWLKVQATGNIDWGGLTVITVIWVEYVCFIKCLKMFCPQLKILVPKIFHSFNWIQQCQQYLHELHFCKCYCRGTGQRLEWEIVDRVHCMCGWLRRNATVSQDCNSAPFPLTHSLTLTHSLIYIQVSSYLVWGLTVMEGSDPELEITDTWC